MAVSLIASLIGGPFTPGYAATDFILDENMSYHEASMKQDGETAAERKTGYIESKDQSNMEHGAQQVHDPDAHPVINLIDIGAQDGGADPPQKSVSQKSVSHKSRPPQHRHSVDLKPCLQLVRLDSQLRNILKTGREESVHTSSYSDKNVSPKHMPQLRMSKSMPKIIVDHAHNEAYNAVTGIIEERRENDGPPNENYAHDFANKLDIAGVEEQNVRSADKDRVNGAIPGDENVASSPGLRNMMSAELQNTAGHNGVGGHAVEGLHHPDVINGLLERNMQDADLKLVRDREMVVQDEAGTGGAGFRPARTGVTFAMDDFETKEIAEDAVTTNVGDENATRAAPFTLASQWVQTLASSSDEDDDYKWDVAGILGTPDAKVRLKRLSRELKLEDQAKLESLILSSKASIAEPKPDKMPNKADNPPCQPEVAAPPIAQPEPSTGAPKRQSQVLDIQEKFFTKLQQRLSGVDQDQLSDKKSLSEAVKKSTILVKKDLSKLFPSRTLHKDREDLQGLNSDLTNHRKSFKNAQENKIISANSVERTTFQLSRDVGMAGLNNLTSTNVRGEENPVLPDKLKLTKCLQPEDIRMKSESESPTPEVFSEGEDARLQNDKETLQNSSSSPTKVDRCDPMRSSVSSLDGNKAKKSRIPVRKDANSPPSQKTPDQTNMNSPQTKPVPATRRSREKSLIPTFNRSKSINNDRSPSPTKTPSSSPTKAARSASPSKIRPPSPVKIPTTTLNTNPKTQPTSPTKPRSTSPTKNSKMSNPIKSRSPERKPQKGKLNDSAKRLRHSLDNINELRRLQNQDAPTLNRSSSTIERNSTSKNNRKHSAGVEPLQIDNTDLHNNNFSPSSGDSLESPRGEDQGGDAHRDRVPRPPPVHKSQKAAVAIAARLILLINYYFLSIKGCSSHIEYNGNLICRLVYLFIKFNYFKESSIPSNK